MRKVKLFTHNDLDAVGCAIIAQLKFGKDNVSIEYCDYTDINEKVENFYKEGKFIEYDDIFITDISVKEDLATIISHHMQYYKDSINLKLFDHHPTALGLNKFDWCQVIIEDKLIWEDERYLNNKYKTCGTYLFYKYLLETFSSEESFINKYNISYFVELVRQYDTWEWKNIFNTNSPKQLNDLFYIMGREDFISTLSSRLRNFDIFKFSEVDMDLLKYRQIEIDNYIKKKNKELIVKNLIGCRVGFVFADKFQSELGNKLCELRTDLDCVAMIGLPNLISYRSIGDFDVSQIAGLYGGGGHRNASGSQINENTVNNIINEIFGRI